MNRFALAALLAACSSSAAPPRHEAAPAPAWRARELGGARPIDPRTSDASLLDARGCATCHAEVAAEWATSRHALAWTNGIFQREYSARPQPWCVNCHAPLTTQQAGQFESAGVDCASCHVRDGRLVAATKRAGSPHETTVDASFGSPAYCADCHQFTFPVLDARGAVQHMTAHPMQTTVASFAEGPFAKEQGGCMTCHGSKANHAFLGGHDPGMLAGALEVDWCRTADAQLHLSIKNAAAGHTVPTGDVHRHLSMRAWRSTAPDGLFDAFLGRRFEPSDDGGKTTSWDSTLAPGEVRAYDVALSKLGGEDDEPINLEVIYVFIEAELRPVAGADEPPSTSVLRWRKAPAEIPACPRAAE